jgi:hypothetical protein
MRDVVSRDGFKDDDDDESACYRTTTTSQTSSIACVDVCVEFPMALTKENSNRVCRSQPYYGKEGEIDSKLKACERACLDAHAASVALKFPDDKEETRRDYGVVAKNECAKRCATSFPKAEEEEEQQQQQQQH